MDVTHEVYRGLECLRISNGLVSVWLTKSVGLRLIGLTLPGHQDLLANLPESTIDLPDGGRYHLRGGHRLWYAPERPESTYHPDDRPVESVIGEGYVQQIQLVDGPTGIQKSWLIRLAERRARIEIAHRLTNLGEDPITLAPWAITMLRPDGVGLLPQQSVPVDKHGLQPNRHLVIWPYTPVRSPHIIWSDPAIFVRADMQEGALKIGSPNPQGWMAYVLDDLLFVKRAAYQQAARYLDRGASSQIYLSPDTIELETLGPEAKLDPRGSVVHEEVWDVCPVGSGEEEVLALYEAYRSSGRQSP